MKKNLLYIVSGATICFLAAVFFYFNQSHRNSTITQIPVVRPVNPTLPNQVTLTLYFSDKDTSSVRPEKRTIRQPGKPLEEIIIEQLILGPKDPSLNKTLPPETRLVSLEVKNGVAYVNFSQELQTRYWGGTTSEFLTIYSIVNSLTEIPRIKKVQFLLAGKKEPSIFGHAVTSEPISRKEDLITK